MLKNISAAIFDMDGTLIDSMWVWDTIDIKYLKKRGFSVPDKLRDDIIHLSFEETALYFKNRFNLSDSIEEIVNEWNDLAYIEYASNVNLKPYAKEYLSKLKAKGIKLAIATSNCTMLLETVLKRHGIYDLFDVITTTDEVDRGKDFPDVYLLSAKKLSVSPSECVVFEDILPAVMGAKAAGMKVVGVHDSYSEYQKNDIMNNADIYINGYREISEAV